MAFCVLTRLQRWFTLGCPRTLVSAHSHALRSKSLGGSPGTELLMWLPLHWNCFLVVPTEHLLLHLPRPRLPSFWSPLRSHCLAAAASHIPFSSDSLTLPRATQNPGLSNLSSAFAWLPTLPLGPGPTHAREFSTCVCAYVCCVCEVYVYLLHVYVCVCTRDLTTLPHHAHGLLPNAGPPNQGVEFSPC